MPPHCPDCDTELVSAEPVTEYDEIPLKVRTDQPHEGRLARLLGMHQSAKIEGYLCPDCRRLLFYADEP